MTFFERLAGHELRFDRNGRLVFCPWGSPFGGAIIATKSEEKRVRHALGRCYRIVLLGVSLPVIALFAFGQISVAILWALIGSVWFLIMRHRIVREFEVTNDFLPFAPRSTEATRELTGLGFASLLTAFCGAIAFGMFYSASLSADPQDGLIGGSIFSALAAIGLYVVIKKVLS